MLSLEARFDQDIDRNGRIGAMSIPVELGSSAGATSIASSLTMNPDVSNGQTDIGEFAPTSLRSSPHS